MGGASRCEYAIIGDVVNMAARLMGATKEEIRCDLETYTRSCKRIVYEQLEPIKVKGKQEKIEVFKPVTGTVSAALSLRKIPLIGRDEEMAIVHRCVDVFADTSKSSTIIFFGEAGVGKSRMLEETLDFVRQHQLPQKPQKGNYEAMPGGGVLSFAVALLMEHWNLKESMSCVTLD